MRARSCACAAWAAPTRTAACSLGDTLWDFDGQEIFKRAVNGMAQRLAEGAARSAASRADEIDLVVPHQANLRIIESVAKRAGMPMDKVFVTVQHYGNMSAATVPVALVEALEEGRVKPGATDPDARFRRRPHAVLARGPLGRARDAARHERRGAAALQPHRARDGERRSAHARTRTTVRTRADGAAVRRGGPPRPECPAWASRLARRPGGGTGRRRRALGRRPSARGAPEELLVSSAHDDRRADDAKTYDAVPSTTSPSSASGSWAIRWPATRAERPRGHGLQPHAPRPTMGRRARRAPARHAARGGARAPRSSSPASATTTTCARHPRRGRRLRRHGAGRDLRRPHHRLGRGRARAAAAAASAALHSSTRRSPAARPGAENGALTVMCGGDAAAVRARAAGGRWPLRAPAALMGAAGRRPARQDGQPDLHRRPAAGPVRGPQFRPDGRPRHEAVLEVIGKGAAQSWQMDNRGKTMIDDKFDFGFAVDWMRKDLGTLPRRGASATARRCRSPRWSTSSTPTCRPWAAALGHLEPDPAAAQGR